MALDENIPLIFDSTTSQNGVIWGSTMQYILSNGGRETAPPYSGLPILDKCCFVKPSKLAPMLQQCLVKESTNPEMTISGVFTTLSTNMAYFLVNNGWENAYSEPSGASINNSYSYDIASGATRQYPRPYAQLYPNARLAVGNLDLSKYFIVPTIRAVRHRTTAPVISADVKTYISQYMAEYPDIISIEYTIRYKADLNSASTGAATNYRLCGTTQTLNNVLWRRSTAVGNYINKYATKFTNTRLCPITVLYAPPTLRYFKVQVPFSSPAVYLPSICCDIGLSSTHAPNIQELVLDNEDYQQATKAYMCIHLGTARQILDSLGMWWVESVADIADAHGALTTSDDVHCPVIDENGVPQGTITGGGVTDINDSPIYQNWNTNNQNFPIGGDDALGAKNIDPTAQIPPNTSNIQIKVNFSDIDSDLAPATPQLNGLGVFSNYYAMRKTGIDILNNFLWNSDETVINDILNSLKLFGQSPINAIISLRLYPFDFLSLLPSAITPENIILGRVDTGVSGYKIPSNCSTTLSLGSMYLQGKYNNFLDFAPYSSYNLYIPFCGTVSLNPNICLNRYITVKMVVDVTTGKCTAIVYVGDSTESGVPIQYVDGMIGVEIPVTSENMGKLASSTIEAVGNTVVSGLTQGVIGGAFAAVGGALDVMFTDVSNSKTGNVSAAGSLSMPIKCYIVTSTPTINKPDNFSHTYGNIANISGTLNNFNGFTICENVDTTGIENATDVEREEIKNLLETGIYL